MFIPKYSSKIFQEVSVAMDLRKGEKALVGGGTQIVDIHHEPREIPLPPFNRRRISQFPTLLLEMEIIEMHERLYRTKLTRAIN